jgi:hypothetical protein
LKIFLLILFKKGEKNEAQSNQLGPTQKRLKEYRTYEQNIKQTRNPKPAEEPFIENRHPKVFINRK